MNILDRTKSSLVGNWCKGAADANDRMCVMAHMSNSANQAFDDYTKGRDLLLEVVRSNYPDRIIENISQSYKPVADFNDHPDTTEEDVIAMLEKASVLYDEVYA